MSQIKNEYQAGKLEETKYQSGGADYNAVDFGTSENHPEFEWIYILSPQLKKLCREWFGIPAEAKFHPDYIHKFKHTKIENDEYYNLLVYEVNEDRDVLFYGKSKLAADNGGYKKEFADKIARNSKCNVCGQEIDCWQEGRNGFGRAGGNGSPEDYHLFHLNCYDKYWEKLTANSEMSWENRESPTIERFYKSIHWHKNNPDNQKEIIPIIQV